MDRLAALARQWPRLTPEAREYQWNRLEPGERERLQALLEAGPGGPQAAPLAGQTPSWRTTERVILVGVLALGVVAGAVWAMRSATDIMQEAIRSEVAGPQDSRSSSPALVLSDLESDSVTYGAEPAYVTIEGRVTNNGPGMVSFVQIRCALDRSTRQENGADLTYAVGAEGLPAGSSRSFELMIRRPEESWQYFAQCRLFNWRSGMNDPSGSVLRHLPPLEPYPQLPTCEHPTRLRTYFDLTIAAVL